MDDQTNFFGTFMNEEEKSETSSAVMDSSDELLNQLLLDKDEATPAAESDDESFTFSTELEEQVERHRALLQSRLDNYIEQSQQQPISSSPLLFFEQWPASVNLSLYPLSQVKSRGGFFFAFGGEGVVINPTGSFLDSFHAQGSHIRQIHHVIITGSHPEYLEALKSIYDLNLSLNMRDQSHHLIKYFIEPKAAQAAMRLLKPHFKQEREALRLLDFFEDSAPIEQLSLSNAIELSYFQSSADNLGVSFSLTREGEQPQKISFLSECNFSEDLYTRLQGSDILILGVGNVTAEDLSRSNYLSGSLGYNGIASLLEAVSPRLALLTQFPQETGDIRLELSRKLKEKFSQTSILPVDQQLAFDLETVMMRCSETKRWIDPVDAVVLKNAKPFGPLKFLSKDFIL